MSLGLSGSSGSGKSTLARAFAEKNSWAMIESPGSACFRELDLPYVGLSFADRMRVQNLILDRFAAACDKQRGLWISDRTPLCMAAFTMAEWGQRCDAEQGEELLRYVDRCIKVTNTHFSLVMIVQPGIPYVDDGTRPPPNRAGVELHTMLCFELMRRRDFQPVGMHFLRHAIDLQVRIDTLTELWNNLLEKAYASRQGQPVH